MFTSMMTLPLSLGALMFDIAFYPGCCATVRKLTNNSKFYYVYTRRGRDGHRQRFLLFSIESFFTTINLKNVINERNTLFCIVLTTFLCV